MVVIGNRSQSVIMCGSKISGGWKSATVRPRGNACRNMCGGVHVWGCTCVGVYMCPHLRRQLRQPRPSLDAQAERKQQRTLQHEHGLQECGVCAGDKCMEEAWGAFVSELFGGGEGKSWGGGDGPRPAHLLQQNPEKCSTVPHTCCDKTLESSSNTTRKTYSNKRYKNYERLHLQTRRQRLRLRGLGRQRQAHPQQQRMQQLPGAVARMLPRRQRRRWQQQQRREPQRGERRHGRGGGGSGGGFCKPPDDQALHRWNLRQVGAPGGVLWTRLVPPTRRWCPVSDGLRWWRLQRCCKAEGGVARRTVVLQGGRGCCKAEGQGGGGMLRPSHPDRPRTSYGAPKNTCAQREHEC
eukprot:363820-Chlamydomonas_euryale.AAC.3